MRGVVCLTLAACEPSRRRPRGRARAARLLATADRSRRRLHGDDAAGRWLAAGASPAARGTRSSTILRDYFGVAWYKTTFEMPKGRTPHVLIRFGAVDYAAEIYVNGHRAGAHEGAYTPFSVDVADFVRSGTNEVLVRVVDPPPTAQGASPRFPDMPYEELPRGKQNWYIENGGLWQPVTLDVQAVAVHGARARQREDRRHSQRGRGGQGRQPASTDDDQGVDSGAGRVHRRGTAAGAGVAGRRAAHDRRREVAAVVVALRASRSTP